MKLTKSFEHGVTLVAILATQKPLTSVSSLALHREVQGSLTYTKKILRKLVVADIVESVSGINGGYRLKHQPSDITLDQLVYALEGTPFSTFPNTGVFQQLFGNVDKEKVERAEMAIHDVFQAADDAWINVLKQVTLADLIKQATYNQPFQTMDWNKGN